MCDLCSTDPDERKKARDASIRVAERLHRLAGVYEDMAHGVIKPHTKEAGDAGHLARDLVRALVEEWV
jgi:hypothetical protein